MAPEFIPFIVFVIPLVKGRIEIVAVYHELKLRRQRKEHDAEDLLWQISR